MELRDYGSSLLGRRLICPIHWDQLILHLRSNDPLVSFMSTWFSIETTGIHWLQWASLIAFNSFTDSSDWRQVMTLLQLSSSQHCIDLKSAAITSRRVKLLRDNKLLGNRAPGRSRLTANSPFSKRGSLSGVRSQLCCGHRELRESGLQHREILKSESGHLCIFKATQKTGGGRVSPCANNDDVTLFQCEIIAGTWLLLAYSCTLC